MGTLLDALPDIFLRGQDSIYQSVVESLRGHHDRPITNARIEAGAFLEAHIDEGLMDALQSLGFVLEVRICHFTKLGDTILALSCLDDDGLDAVLGQEFIDIQAFYDDSDGPKYRKGCPDQCRGLRCDHISPRACHVIDTDGDIQSSLLFETPHLSRCQSEFRDSPSGTFQETDNFWSLPQLHLAVSSHKKVDHICNVFHINLS